jgi:hypothetical protein
MRDLLSSFDYEGKSKAFAKPDRDVVFFWSPEKKDRLAH